MRTSLVLTFIAILAIPAASAGTAEAPEVTDPAGDCQFAPGNHYADIVAAWISDETADDFIVNIKLSEFIAESAGLFAGYTLQFSHQGVQWGVAALLGQDGWEWTTAQIDTTTGEMGGFNDTTGQFDASTLTMSILFPKSLFPHDGNDNKLSGFEGGTADFKKDVPIFILQGFGAPAPDPMITFCDLVESAATYTFTVGRHTMHDSAASASNETMTADASIEPQAVDNKAPAATTSPKPARGVPGPGILVLLATIAIAAVRRAKR